MILKGKSMRNVVWISAVLLAGCVGVAGPSRPVAARLSQETLKVSMSDGRICETPWAALSGRMEACGLDWRVEPEANPNPLRRAFVELTGALQMAGNVPPMATVTLTDAGGHGYGFVSPQKLE